MQFNITTDYAIRTVLYLGQCKEIASATEISREMSIPRGYLEKVLSKLKRAEYISADLGAKGGYYLNKSLGARVGGCDPHYGKYNKNKQIPGRG